MKKRQPTVLFYVSGHGFGHSTRCIEVARQLPEDVRVIFRTSAPRWLYECYFERPLEFRPLQLDVGVIQTDSLTLDAKRTLEAYAAMLEEAPRLIESESQFVREEGVDVIVGDIPPAAFEIAARAGIASVALGNFSWDWIYGPYIKQHPEYGWLIESIRQAYSKCDLLLRLPFYGDLSVFPQIVDNPLVVRSPQCSREELRQRLRIERDSKVALLSFGGFDLERIPWERVERMSGYHFIYFRQAVSAHNVRHISNGSMPHVDIVQMSDVVLSKPGYGICAECVRTQTPIIYTDRGEFLEYERLVEGLHAYGRALHIPQAELVAGHWEPYLEQALELLPTKRMLPTDGGRIAAERIMALSGK